MKVLSWLGGLVIIVAIAVAGVSSLTHPTSTAQHSLTAARQPILGPSYMGPQDPGDPRPRRPEPEPTPPPPPPVEAAPVAANPAPPASAPAPPPPPPAVVVNSTQQALINQDRAANGLGPLTWNGCLYNVAVSNAQRIAAQHALSHTNGPQVDLGCGLGRQAGENVGYWSNGINDGQINTLFMNSPEHRANILGPYHYVATAWVVGSDGRGYIAVEFS
jgi:uncharacterized protein YkwD